MSNSFERAPSAPEPVASTETSEDRGGPSNTPESIIAHDNAPHNERLLVLAEMQKVEQELTNQKKLLKAEKGAIGKIKKDLDPMETRKKDLEKKIRWVNEDKSIKKEEEKIDALTKMHAVEGTSFTKDEVQRRENIMMRRNLWAGNPEFIAWEATVEQMRNNMLKTAKRRTKEGKARLDPEEQKQLLYIAKEVILLKGNTSDAEKETEQLNKNIKPFAIDKAGHEAEIQKIIERMQNLQNSIRRYRDKLAEKAKN